MNKKITWSLLVILLGTFLISGCAKKTVSETTVEEVLSDIPETGQNIEAYEESTEPLKNEALTSVGLERVYFEFDQFVLTEKARGVLAANAEFLQAVPTLKVSIEGHCDSRGSDEYNLALGEHRSQVVKKYLVSLGISPERMETVSYGEEMPIDRGASEMAWAANRRAEFKVIN
jgi:peptidoglycan-associated lipoprotein